MIKLFTLFAVAALGTATLSAQAQFTIDGTLGAGELGTGLGKYQLAGTYTNAHSVADRGLKALYVGTTATTLNVLVVASPEQPNGAYTAMVFYLHAPNKTNGVPAGTRLPGVSVASGPNYSPLRHRPTLDFQTDYGFRITTSPFNDTNNAIYLSRVDYTSPPASFGYAEIGEGSNPKNGTLTFDTNDLGNVQTAYQTSATGSLLANTTTGWEFSIPLSTIGGAATGSQLQFMVAYINDDSSFYSDVLPQVVGQTPALGFDPNFSTIPGNQYYTYQVGRGVLGTRTANNALAASAYPNPVAAGSRLTYTVAEAAAPVTVTAYNALGQRALTLLDNATQPAGEHSLALAPLQDLAAGMYLLRVQAGRQFSTQRVVVH